jgi:serine/threonine-protein kinase HipA
LGIASYATSIENFSGTTALVIQRYDRCEISEQTPDGRLHQEDFSQALGASRPEKYQEQGGKVSLARVAQVVSNLQGNAGLEKLLIHATLGFVVGNLDLHAKNISLLRPPDGWTDGHGDQSQIRTFSDYTRRPDSRDHQLGIAY